MTSAARRIRTWIPLFAFLLTCLAALPAALAQSDAATAQALFDEGKRLLDEKKYAEACPKLEESQRLDPAIGTKYHLARCYEAIGRSATAWSIYIEVADEAKSKGQADRESTARDAAKALETKLVRLKIDVATPAEGLEVQRNGKPIGGAQWGMSIPVDPGTIRVVAWAPNRKVFETSVTLDTPGQSETVSVPELEKGRSKPPPGFGGTPPGGGYGYPPPPNGPLMKRRSTGLMAGGIVAASLGLPVTIVGAIGVAADGEFARTIDWAGPTLGLGLVLIGGGITMAVIGGKKVPVEGPQQASFVPEVQVGPTSAKLKWAF